MSRVDVDYQYYADVFKGDALTESDLKKHGMRAEAIVNRMTYGRIHELNCDRMTGGCQSCHMCGI